MKERNTFEEELASLRVPSIPRNRAAPIAAESGFPQMISLPERHEYESPTKTYPPAGESAPFSLQGNPEGRISLQNAVEEYLSCLDTDRPFGKYKLPCVVASMMYFANSCKSKGVRTIPHKIRFKVKEWDTDEKYKVKGKVEIPRIARSNGEPVSWRNFFTLWFSLTRSKKWAKFRPQYKGGGAPGALLYAGLTEGDRLFRHSDGWPTNLRPGSFLQLWENENVYKRVQAGNQGWGHSLIFRRYLDARTIVAADQLSTLHKFTWSKWNMKYVIAANLKSVDLVP